MNMMKRTAIVLWATVWLVTQATKDIVVSFVDLMRIALGEDGKTVDIITFLIYMSASVVVIGFTGMLIAASQIN